MVLVPDGGGGGGAPEWWSGVRPVCGTGKGWEGEVC